MRSQTRPEGARLPSAAPNPVDARLAEVAPAEQADTASALSKGNASRSLEGERVLSLGGERVLDGDRARFLCFFRFSRLL